MLQKTPDFKPIFRPATMASRWPARLPSGPRSVFELAARPVKWQALALEAPSAAVYRIERLPGLVRRVQIPLCESQAWKDKEARRRAKQRPPPPGARFRGETSSRFAKLISLPA